MAFSDSLAGRQRAEAIANAEIRWKAEKKQSEINQLTKERLLQSAVIAQTSKLNNRLTWLIIFILSVFALMIIIAVQFIKNKEKQKKILFQLHMKEVTLLKHKNLNSRLSPHMFFNLLNSLGDSLEEREKMMHQIRETTSLLRSSLENAEEMAIPLSRELDMVKSYLELQKSRIPEPFTLEILISDTVNMDALLPAMSIHIPVENAIKHGLMPLEGSKVLKINIENQEEELRIRVLDNGIGRLDSEKRTKGTGTGLKLIYQTIHLLNQQNRNPIKVSINDLEPRGTEFTMTIPRKYSFDLKYTIS
jgi:LytS/YehU family sensor histidine kinase